MIFDKLFGRRKRDSVPRAIYASIVAQARQPALYEEHGVPDTLEGRFEMVVLHAVLVLRRIRAHEGADSELGEEVCAVMFSDFDHNLREIGIGDTSVGKKVRQLAEAFYGRGKALDAAFASDHPRGAVAEVLARNLFPDSDPAAKILALDGLAAYVIAADEALDSATLDDIIQARLPFPDPVSFGGESLLPPDRNRQGALNGAVDG